jgi:predicted secreted protein
MLKYVSVSVITRGKTLKLTVKAEKKHKFKKIAGKSTHRHSRESSIIDMSSEN